MKKLVLAATAVVAFGGQALAADIAARPVKAPPLPVPAANWTGCYVGGGGGYGVYDIETQNFNGNVVPAVPYNRQFDQGGRGWIGSVSGGCDYQFALGTYQLVIGAFGDYNWSDMRGDFTGNGNSVGLVSGREKVDNFWSVGGRIGWLITPQVLTYFSGGFTEAHRTGVSNYLSAANVPSGVGLRGASVQGWFLGSGIEHQIGWIPNLTLKTEYRFSEFDRIDSREYAVATGLNNGNFSRDKLFTQTVMTTLSYRFNFGGPAVVAKY